MAGIIIALAAPAFADDVSGTYLVVTNNGTRNYLTIIQNGDTLTGLFVGKDSGGRLTGKATGHGYSWACTFETQKGDVGQDQAAHGTVLITFNGDGTQLTATWKFAGGGGGGTWSGKLVNP